MPLPQKRQEEKLRKSSVCLSRSSRQINVPSCRHEGENSLGSSPSSPSSIYRPAPLHDNVLRQTPEFRRGSSSLSYSDRADKSTRFHQDVEFVPTPHPSSPSPATEQKMSRVSFDTRRTLSTVSSASGYAQASSYSPYFAQSSSSSQSPPSEYVPPTPFHAPQPVPPGYMPQDSVSPQSVASTYDFGPPASLGPQTTTNELLMIFQSSPLVWEYEKGKFKPMGMLDFKTEQQELRRVLKSTKVKVDLAFDCCTTDRLSNFLIQRKGRVLHYSGHGHPEYLAIEENLTGKLHRLAVEDLEQWIKTGGESLQLVFVSACHSRAAGEAFVAAGVKHVVCCQRDDQMIRNDAAIEFQKAFYQAIANGDTVARAVELGRHKIRTSHQMSPEVAQEEFKKFVLLPEGDDHDVKIFDLENPPSPRTISDEEMLLLHDQPKGIRPLPPDDFEGRQLEMYQVLTALQNTRVVRITGPKNIGKCSIVKGVCQYIEKRQHVFDDSIADTVWLDFDETDGSVDFSAILDADCQNRGNSFASLREEVIYCLIERRVLLVIDARTYSETAFEKVEAFVNDFVQYTEDTKVVLIERHDKPGTIKRFRGKEREIHVGPLSFRSTLGLFGKMCPHVQNGSRPEVANLKDFFNGVLSDVEIGDELNTQIGQDFFKMIGRGIPDIVQETAKAMEPGQYAKLLVLGEGLKKVQEWKQELAFHSRAELENEIQDIQTHFEGAFAKGEDIQAEGFQTFLREMERLREDFPDVESLQRKEETLDSKLAIATQAQPLVFCELASVRQELRDVRTCIDRERTAKKNLLKLRHEKTRYGMETVLVALSEEYSKAAVNHDWGLMRSIGAKIILIERRKKPLKSIRDLKIELKEHHQALRKARDKAIETKHHDDITMAEAIHEKLLKANVRFEAEENAQAYFTSLPVASWERGDLSEGRIAKAKGIQKFGGTVLISVRPDTTSVCQILTDNTSKRPALCTHTDAQRSRRNEDQRMTQRRIREPSGKLNYLPHEVGMFIQETVITEESSASLPIPLDSSLAMDVERKERKIVAALKHEQLNEVQQVDANPDRQLGHFPVEDAPLRGDGETVLRHDTITSTTNEAQAVTSFTTEVTLQKSSQTSDSPIDIGLPSRSVDPGTGLASAQSNTQLFSVTVPTPLLPEAKVFVKKGTVESATEVERLKLKGDSALPLDMCASNRKSSLVPDFKPRLRSSRSEDGAAKPVTTGTECNEKCRVTSSLHDELSILPGAFRVSQLSSDSVHSEHNDADYVMDDTELLTNTNISLDTPMSVVAEVVVEEDRDAEIQERAQEIVNNQPLVTAVELVTIDEERRSRGGSIKRLAKGFSKIFRRKGDSTRR